FLSTSRPPTSTPFPYTTLFRSVAVAVGDREVLREVLVWRRSAANGEEVDQLDEQPRLAAACPPDCLDQSLQAGDEPVVADPQKRPARDVVDAGRLDDERTWTALREALVPAKDLGRDKTVLGRPPWHHGRHPGAVRELYRADRDWREPQRCPHLGGRRLRTRVRQMPVALLRPPHVR